MNAGEHDQALGADAHAGHSPARIAHRAGNNRTALREALAAGVDWIEVDCWWHFGRLIAQHDRPLWPLPFSAAGLSLRRTRAHPLLLPELIDEAAVRTQLLLDFKGRSPWLAGAIVAALQRRNAVSRAAICGQNWPMLSAAARREPGLRVMYSIGSENQLASWRRLSAARNGEMKAASVAHRLLTADSMRDFLERGVEVFAWTVNDVARAEELVRLGVAGITSDRLDLLARLPRGRRSA